MATVETRGHEAALTFCREAESKSGNISVVALSSPVGSDAQHHRISVRRTMKPSSTVIMGRPVRAQV